MILASGSPRRRELLARIVEAFDVIPADIDEESFVEPDPFELAKLLATRKAEAVFALRPDAVVIGADTIVVLGDRVLNKPADESDAKRMLAALSGRSHRVITGLAVLSGGDRSIIAPSTKVTFRELSAEEIAAYVATGEPMDKAGGYAIQGGAAAFATSYEGDLDTVVGLPIALLRGLLLNTQNGTEAR